MSMTPEQKRKFQELLGEPESDRLLWDSLPVSVRRMLVFAAGLQAGSVFTPWSSIPDVDRQYLNKAAGELADWAEFTRQRMAAKHEGVAA